MATTATPSFQVYEGPGPENYERYFVPAIAAPLAGDLVELGEVSSGDRVLDLACGTGVVARLAAERVGPEGLVTGLDMNPGMLAVAHSVTAAPVDWRQGNAEAMDLPDGAYDAVLCQLGLQFFPDLPAALREQRRVLASGGRFAASTPGPTPGLFTVLEDELRDHVGAEATAFVRVVFRLHEPDTLHDLLADAGFDDVAVHRRRYKLRLPLPAEFLWQYVWSTPLAAVLTELDDARRAAFERDIVMQWERFTQDDRLLLELDVLYAAARVRGSA